MKQLQPRGRRLAARGAPATGAPVRSRDRIDTWRKWYHTAEWRALRWATLEAAHFTCARCRRVAESPDLVADHDRPHRGDRDLFFDPANLVCLCAPCHNRDKQREERAAAAMRP